MLYPSDLELKIGFDQIREKVKLFCLCTLGTKKVDELQFSSDFNAIQSALLQTNELKKILEKGDPFPSSHFFDPHDLLATIAIEGTYIEEKDFLSLAYSMQTILACKNFLG
ncbi:MAG: endonuclease MutS2, partial [Flammeovirgaceae bacterium]|nr:endonuclease MutS2 [Flammeovirgaceae bacterium]